MTQCKNTPDSYQVSGCLLNQGTRKRERLFSVLYQPSHCEA